MPSTKTNNSQPPRSPSAIEQAALDWLARFDRGVTPAEESEFERWLAADSRHAELFNEFDGTWNLLGRVRETPEAAAARMSRSIDPDVFAPSRSVAATAALSPVAVPVRTIRFPLAHSLSLLSLAAAAAFVVAYLGWWAPAHFADRRNADYAGSAVTELGELRKLRLPDGSVVQLNTDSAVQVRFTSVERRVKLTHGEAHFTVAKNSARPFTVSVAGVDVRAVGTAFNVRLRLKAVEVLVTEGKVRINNDPSGGSVPTGAKPSPSLESATGTSTERLVPSGFRSLCAGEKVTILLAPRAATTGVPALPAVVSAVEIDRALAWQERRLEFVSVPLEEIVAEFNRYNRLKLVIADPGLAAQRFGGTFRPDDPAAFVRILESHFTVYAEKRDGETILRLAP